MHRWLLLLAWAMAGLPIGAKTPDETAASLAPPAETTLMPTPHKEWDVLDSDAAIDIRPVPAPEETTPAFLDQVDYLRAHDDLVMAVSYLQKVITNGDLTPRYRSQAMLELADCLDTANRKAESLCWLKIWMELYPGRPEFGAVAYRVGVLYTKMGLPALARDAYYQALSSAINQGQVKSNDDLTHYTRLTVATLWALATNEYRAGQWDRAAELFARYRREAVTASPISQERAAFLQADCYYQLKQNDTALASYYQALTAHPFNPLAPEGRLRLYHLYLLENATGQAREELQSLVWTVRTVWPKDEAYWQQRTAELLLALNRKNGAVLPPLLAKSSQLPAQGKAWQKELEHYDKLVDLQALTQTTMANTSPSSPAASRPGSDEKADLTAMRHSIDELSPSLGIAQTP